MAAYLRFAAMFVALFGAGCAQLPSDSQQQAPARVLYIGNSYTFYFDMPRMVSALGRGEGSPRQLPSETVTRPGVALQNHWESGVAQRAIREGGWDYVVLQEQSGLPLDDRASMYKHVRLFDQEIRRVGARTVLFLTWARRDRPATQAGLDEAYGGIGKELGAIVAPVGPAWQVAREQIPNVKLYDDDGSHPTRAGSYLTACVLYLAMQPGESRCPPDWVFGIPSGVAERLRAVAARAAAAAR